MVMKQGNYSQCLPLNQSIEATIHLLCAFIWNERNIIIALNTPNILRDLFIEQSKFKTQSTLNNDALTIVYS